MFIIKISIWAYQLFVIFYVIRELKGREDSIFGPQYLENYKYFEKHYWTKVVQNDAPSIMRLKFFRYLLP